MTIRVLSFDFDGALFHKNYVFSTTKDVNASNKEFLDAIKADNYLFNKTITLVGSHRQSKGADDTNIYKFYPAHGLLTISSCFPAIQKISEYLEAELDIFLLADLYEDLPHGTSFSRALESLKDLYVEVEHAKWLIDETKATVLYAQMRGK